MAKTKRRPSEAERAERRRRDRERLQAAAQQLLTSAGWQSWVRVRSQAGLTRLSLSNQLLVALAGPDATFVAGFKTWLRLGYAVKKGERAIAIIAPMPVKEHDRVSGEAAGETLVLFKTVFVFDRAQVAPIEGAEQAPLEPPCEPLTGDSHAHLIAPMQAFTESLGFTVSFEPIPGAAGGWCDQKAKRIVVDAGAPANARLRTLITWRRWRVRTVRMRGRCGVVGTAPMQPNAGLVARHKLSSGPCCRRGPEAVGRSAAARARRVALGGVGAIRCGRRRGERRGGRRWCRCRGR